MTVLGLENYPGECYLLIKKDLTFLIERATRMQLLEAEQEQVSLLPVTTAGSQIWYYLQKSVGSVSQVDKKDLFSHFMWSLLTVSPTLRNKCPCQDKHR